MAYPRFQRARQFKFVRYQGIDVGVAQTTWVGLGTGDLELAAQVGDVLEVGASYRVSNAAVEMYFDLHTYVSSARVNSVGSGAAAADTQLGIPGLIATSGVTGGIGGGALYTVVAGDISNGLVLLRPVFRGASTTSRQILGASPNFIHYWAKNLGPADPN